MISVPAAPCIQMQIFISTWSSVERLPLKQIRHWRGIYPTLGKSASPFCFNDTSTERGHRLLLTLMHLRPSVNTLGKTPPDILVREKKEVLTVVLGITSCTQVPSSGSLPCPAHASGSRLNLQSSYSCFHHSEELTVFASHCPTPQPFCPLPPGCLPAH